MEEDEPLTVRVMFPPAVEEPPSPTHFHSPQRFSLGQCSKTVFFIHFDRLWKNQFLKDGLDSGPPSLPWTLPSLGRPLLDRPPLTPRLDRPLVDNSSAGPPSAGPPKISLHIPSPALPVSIFCSLWVACAPWSPTSCSVRARTLWLPATPCNFRPYNPSGPLLRLSSCALPCHGGFNVNSELPALQALLFQLRWRCRRHPGQVSLVCSGVPSQLAGALLLTCSNATLTSVLLGTSVDLVSLFAFALLCHSRSRTTLARPFLETETVWGPSTSMISRTCHKWITGPPPAAVHGNPVKVRRRHF